MTEIKINIPDDRTLCRLIVDQLRKGGFHEFANQVSRQLTSATVDEPKEFGSIVRAGIDGISDRVLWVRSAAGYWFSETSRRADFSDLYHPEVLRIGVGEAAGQETKRCHCGYNQAWAWLGRAGQQPGPHHSKMCDRHTDGEPSDFDRANMADESARLDEANHDHVSLAVVLRVLDEVRTASITATEQEAVRRCHTAVMKLPTYVGCWP